VRQILQRKPEEISRWMIEERSLVSDHSVR